MNNSLMHGSKMRRTCMPNLRLVAQSSKVSASQCASGNTGALPGHTLPVNPNQGVLLCISISMLWLYWLLLAH
jgi:hypothetical protein